MRPSLPIINETAVGDELTVFSVLLINHKNEISDITALVTAAEVYESLFKTFMSGRLVINDRVNLLNTLPIVGEERIRITLDCASAPGKKVVDFVVLSIENIDYAANLQGQDYVMFLVTPEAIRNELTSIAQSFRGEISDAAELVYKDHLKSSKKLTIEKTGGQSGQPLIIPRLKPADALTFLRRRAMSAETSCHLFLSFETTEGFTFATPEKMLSTSPVTRFMASHSVTKLFRPYDVLEVRHVKKVDFLEELRMGYYYSQATKFDLVGKNTELIDFKQEKDGQAWKKLEAKKRHTDQFIKDFSEQGSVQYLVPYDSLRKDRSISEVLGSKLAYAANFSQNQLEILVPGNLAVHAGSVIDLALPSPTAEAKETGPQISGKFLVAEVMHNVLNKRKIYSRLLLFKDSFN